MSLKMTEFLSLASCIAFHTEYLSLLGYIHPSSADGQLVSYLNGDVRNVQCRQLPERLISNLYGSSHGGIVESDG